MRRTEWLQETRLMRFEGAYGGWAESRSYPGRGALLLGAVPGHFYLLLTLPSFLRMREPSRGITDYNTPRRQTHKAAQINDRATRVQPH